MPDAPDPAAIARRLTKAQRGIVKYLPAEPGQSCIGTKTMDVEAAVELGAMKCIEAHWSGLLRLTPLGLRVRAVLEQDARDGR